MANAQSVYSQLVSYLSTQVYYSSTIVCGIHNLRGNKSRLVDAWRGSNKYAYAMARYGIHKQKLTFRFMKTLYMVQISRTSLDRKNLTCAFGP